MAESSRLNVGDAEEELVEVPEMLEYVQSFLDYLSTDFPGVFASPEELSDDDDNDDDDDVNEEDEAIDDAMAQVGDLTQLPSIIQNVRQASQATSPSYDPQPSSDDDDDDGTVINANLNQGKDRPL